MEFLNRREAGRRLAARLQHLRGEPVVVLGLPRGGVPVAFEVALALDAPLDVIVVRKLGVPFQPELAMGAIGEQGVRIINDEVVRATGVSAGELSKVEAQERAELVRRARRFRGDRPRLPLRGRTVLVVDDGVATGSTASAACEVARREGAARVVLATPVAPQDWIERMAGAADEYVCLLNPPHFFAIGQFYSDFSPTPDDEVVDCIERIARRRIPVAGWGLESSLARDEDVVVHAGDVQLRGHLTVPPDARGIVVFAHGSGSSRHSPRNRYAADMLTNAGLATLLFDLLTPPEEADRSNTFDIDLLAERLVAATEWLATEAGLGGVRVGYFGASTGAAAALWAATDPRVDVAAVVSRGGRPDLAGPRLHAVRAPTLLVVGGNDSVVLDLNRAARTHMHCESRLAVIPGATHLFEEPGTLKAAVELARDWFVDHLDPHPLVTSLGAASTVRV
jgi:putative phosphoribosyl transferase